MASESHSLRERVAAELPYLRRYARAITGSQSLGDGVVRELLEAIVAAPDQFQPNGDARAELFHLFHRLWQPQALQRMDLSEGAISSLPIVVRAAMLLTMVEGFSNAQAAAILELADGDVGAMLISARNQLSRSLHGSVMIIEDESIIAMHLQKIVRSLGNTVPGVARTKREAVALARECHPDLILADISLADGSSGIDAIKEILDEFTVPVIFITAFPQRLLTGERPEPTYLITKPFEPETVTATIWQALLVDRESRSGLRAA